ncbi:DUF3293 domain-containing protein [Dokdonella sp.]|uniref:DUF3293 domain-containing protein n=1 Tax=Dokdonella sp. TaxID=2291710 RepID=UPI003C635724
MPDPAHGGPSPQALVDLYSRTRYDLRLPGGSRTTVCIGHSCPATLRGFLADTLSAFLISACNPHSVPLDIKTNRKRMQQLLQRLKAANPPRLPGVGHIPGQPWREPLLLVAIPDVKAIDGIARQFGQNAIIHLQANRPARLRIYRIDWQPHVRESADIEWAAQPA